MFIMKYLCMEIGSLYRKKMAPVSDLDVQSVFEILGQIQVKWVKGVF